MGHLQRANKIPVPCNYFCLCVAKQLHVAAQTACLAFSILPGPSCSKLMTWLVNVSLKFQMLKSDLCHYFLSKKCEKLLQSSAKASLIVSTKNFSVFGYKVNELTS